MTSRNHLWLIVGLIGVLSLFGLSMAFAQENPGGTIAFNGTISAMEDDRIVVNGLTVSLANVAVDVTVAVGAQVNIMGTLQADGQIIATFITVVVQAPQASATPIPAMTTTPPAMTATPDGTTTPEPGGVIVVIEGPVQAININIITIYSINIAVNADDPILTVIQIGDIVRVQGEFVDDEDDLDGLIVLDDDANVNVVINLIAIQVTIINVEVVVNVGGEVWRDSEDCSNPPPPWAPAHGWRRRCEGGEHPGRGRDDDDDDDD